MQARSLWQRPFRFCITVPDAMWRCWAICWNWVCAASEHYKVGRIAAEKVDVLLAYGPYSVKVLGGAVTGGMSQTKARAFTDKEKLVQVLKQLAKPGDVLLFKGSRGMRMEEVLEKFLEEEK